jgi:hypothetical protein
MIAAATKLAVSGLVLGLMVLLGLAGCGTTGDIQVQEVRTQKNEVVVRLGTGHRSTTVAVVIPCVLELNLDAGRVPIDLYGLWWQLPAPDGTAARSERRFPAWQVATIRASDAGAQRSESVTYRKRRASPFGSLGAPKFPDGDCAGELWFFPEGTVLNMRTLSEAGIIGEDCYFASSDTFSRLRAFGGTETKDDFARTIEEYRRRLARELSVDLRPTPSLVGRVRFTIRQGRIETQDPLPEGVSLELR